VLNMISTGAMIEIGKTYGNLMVDVLATNSKLQARAVRIVRHVSGSSADDAEKALSEAGGSAKVAIVLLHRSLSAVDARQHLEDAGGFLRAALRSE
jgi:N-acetylmuramic acid 6-phosphate etherase